MKRLSQIDTNLLVALDVLLEERHVTRTAARLGVTQSAMSQTLRRLRDTFDDPLLVRSGAGMVPTPRAESIRGALRVALRSLEETLNTVERFDPTTATRTFRFACLDIYGVNLVPALFNLFGTCGDGLGLRVAALHVGRVYEQLRTSDAEIALLTATEPPADISTSPFIEERMLSMVRVGHPILNAEVDVEAYTRWPHVVFSLTGRGDHAIDRWLAELGTRRRVVGHTPSFLSAPSVVMDSDLIVTVPRSAACVFARRHPVALFVPPFSPIHYSVELAWPRYLDADPGHQWFRGQIEHIGQAMMVTNEACRIHRNAEV